MLEFHWLQLLNEKHVCFSVFYYTLFFLSLHVYSSVSFGMKIKRFSDGDGQYFVAVRRCIMLEQKLAYPSMCCISITADQSRSKLEQINTRDYCGVISPGNECRL